MHHPKIRVSVHEIIYPSRYHEESTQKTLLFGLFSSFSTYPLLQVTLAPSPSIVPHCVICQKITNNVQNSSWKCRFTSPCHYCDIIVKPFSCYDFFVVNDLPFTPSKAFFAITSQRPACCHTSNTRNTPHHVSCRISYFGLVFA